MSDESQVLSETIAHEVLGQSVVYPVFQAVGWALGMALTNQVINPDYVLLQEEGIDSYCQQVCGGGMCGVGPVCDMGIDSSTQLPTKYISGQQTQLAMLWYAGCKTFLRWACSRRRSVRRR